MVMATKGLRISSRSLVLALHVAGARTCYFEQINAADGKLQIGGGKDEHDAWAPKTTLLRLEQTIYERVEAA